MQIKCLYDELVSVNELKPHPKNRNKHPKEQVPELAEILKYQGWRYPIKVSKLSGYITSGHGRLLSAKYNKWDKVPVNFQDYDDEEQEYADVQADNAIASWAELDLSGINLDIGDLGPNFNIKMLGIKDFVIEPAEKYESDSNEKIDYTNKIEIPIYTPKGEEPKISELFDLEKSDSLVRDIEGSELKEDVKKFLKYASYRHIVFNYEKIAEFYCHQDAKTQNLMEKSALVIIDFNKAIESGFIKMTKEIADLNE